MPRKKFYIRLAALFAVLAVLASAAYVKSGDLELAFQNFIAGKLHDYIRNVTGAPLVSEESAEITLFPSRGIFLKKSSWEKGRFRASFSSADALISSHHLFWGKFVLKRLTINDLIITIRLDGNIRDMREQAAAAVSRIGPAAIIRRCAALMERVPNEVEINNGLILAEHPDGHLVKLDNLHFSAANINPESGVEFSLQCQEWHTGATAPLNAEASGIARVEDSKASVSIERTAISPAGSGRRLPCSLSGEIAYDAVKDELSFPSAVLERSDLSARLSGTAGKVSSFILPGRYGDVSAHVDLKGDPVALFRSRALFESLPDFPETFSLSSDITFAGGSLRLRNIKASVDGVSCEGDLDTQLPVTELTGSLRFGVIPLDQLMERGRSLGFIPLPFPDPNSIHALDLKLHADEIRWKKMPVQNADCRLFGKSGKYEFNPLSLQAAGSQVTASLGLEILPTAPVSANLTLNADLPHADLATLCRTFVPAARLEGSAALALELSWSSSRAWSSLNGKGTLFSNDAVIPPSFLNRLGIPYAAGDADRKEDELFAAFDISRGILTAPSFVLNASGIHLTGTGKVDFRTRSIDASGMFSKPGQFSCPMAITGQLDSPSFSLGGVRDRAGGIRFSFPAQERR